MSRSSILSNQSNTILNQLADQRRRVVSDWRALIILRRAMLSDPAQHAAVVTIPEEPHQIKAVLSSMVRQKQIKPHEGTTGIYVVVTPYSSTVPLTDMELLGEMNPYATLSHFTALTLHRLTNQFPNELYATVSRKQLGNEVPVGTTVDDWEDVAFRPLSRRPKSILSKGVIWSVTTRHNQFGIIERSPYGFPIRLTDLERTIIDAIDSPSKCGGIYSVLEAWKEASSSINVDVLVKYVEQYGKKLLRQRVGYLMEEVGLSHSILNEWKRTAIRGSSAKLNGEQPFSSIYSEDWSLSLNGPVEILRS